MNLPCDVIEIKEDYCVCVKGIPQDGFRLRWSEELQKFQVAPSLPFANGESVSYNGNIYVFNSATQDFLLQV